MTHHRPSRARLAAVTTAALAIAGLGLALAGPASADSTTVDDASLRWGLNTESGGGAFFGGCNFLTAGVAGDTGSSRLWTEADGFYTTQVGNVTIEKPTADGGWVQPTWATKCQDATGATANTTNRVTGNTVLLSHGTGTVDTDAGTATIAWDGDFTVAFYGGLTYWTASDPVLTVSADGTGTLVATGSGYGTTMEDMTIWDAIAPQQITLATFTGLTVDADGFIATPDYLGVEVSTTATPQSRTGATWGSFPQDFVDFQVLTGQSSYWYSSGGAVDPRKPATPATVAWTLAEEPVDPTDPEEPAEGEIDVEVEVPQAPTEPGDPGEFGWSIDGSSTVSLGQATVNENGSFSAAGTLPSITVTDTREQAPAWSLSAQASDFTSTVGTFGAEALGWAPQVSGNSVGAVAGSAVAAGETGLSGSALLAQAPAGHELGEATLSAALTLLAPAGTPAGSYTSTVTVTALS